MVTDQKNQHSMSQAIPRTHRKQLPEYQSSEGHGYTRTRHTRRQKQPTWGFGGEFGGARRGGGARRWGTARGGGTGGPSPQYPPPTSTPYEAGSAGSSKRRRWALGKAEEWSAAEAVGWNGWRASRARAQRAGKAGQRKTELTDGLRARLAPTAAWHGARSIGPRRERVHVKRRSMGFLWVIFRKGIKHQNHHWFIFISSNK
jgi:hypothetical protein